MENKLIKRTFAAIREGAGPAGACPDEIDLACFAEGKMDGEKRALLEQHLISCKQCCDAVVSLHKVVHFPGDELLPEVPKAEVRKLASLVEERAGGHDHITIGVKFWNVLKGFFSFDFIPLPVAVKSCAAAAVVLLVCSATYLYYQQTMPLSLTMEVVGKTPVMATRGTPGEKTVETILAEGDILFSKDYCRIHFELNRDAYAYVLYYDSSGELHQLFPDPEAKTVEALKANTPYTVPAADDQWFQLDDNRGTETVFMLASPAPLSNLKDIYPSIQGLSREEALNVFKNSAPVFRVLSFQHR
jgi:hypothetical protein